MYNTPAPAPRCIRCSSTFSRPRAVCEVSSHATDAGSGTPTYRLIVKGTIEEKIRELQRRKGAVAKDILGEESFAQALTLSDFHFLLEE